MLAYMDLDGIRSASPRMLRRRLKDVLEEEPVSCVMIQDIGNAIGKVSRIMQEGLTRQELSLIDVPGVNNEPLKELYDELAPKPKISNRKVPLNAPSRLFNEGGVEMTGLINMGLVRQHEEKLQKNENETAARKIKVFVKQDVRWKKATDNVCHWLVHLKLQEAGHVFHPRDGVAPWTKCKRPSSSDCYYFMQYIHDRHKLLLNDVPTAFTDCKHMKLAGHIIHRLFAHDTCMVTCTHECIPSHTQTHTIDARTHIHTHTQVAPV